MHLAKEKRRQKQGVREHDGGISNSTSAINKTILRQFLCNHVRQRSGTNPEAFAKQNIDTE